MSPGCSSEVFVEKWRRNAKSPVMPMPKRAKVAGSGTPPEFVTLNVVVAPKVTGVPEKSKALTTPIGPGPGSSNVHSNEAGPAVGGPKETVITDTPSELIVVPGGPDTMVKFDMAVEL
jgi:hypothetical protein